MSIDNLIRGLGIAESGSSGDERRVYEYLIKYLRSGDKHYQRKAMRYYKNLDYGLKYRVDSVGSMILQYLRD